METVTIGGIHQIDKRLLPNNVEKMMADFPVKELFNDNCPDYVSVEKVQAWYRNKFGEPKL